MAEEINSNIVWHAHHITQEDRAVLKGQRPCILWFTGLSGSGKSTIANAVESLLYQEGKHTYLLDGDNVRHGLNKGLTFSEADRIENIRRVGEVSKLFVDSGCIVLTAFISPFTKDRDMIRKMVRPGDFIEIFVDTPIEVCETRDPKGLYKKARAGEIKDFTGITSPYEAPPEPEIHLPNFDVSVQEMAEKVINYLKRFKYI